MINKQGRKDEIFSADPEDKDGNYGAAACVALGTGTEMSKDQLVRFLVDDYLIIIFGFLMGIRVRGMQRNHAVRSKLDELEVNYRCTYEELSNRDYSIIKSVLIDNSTTLKKYIEMSEEDIDPIMAPKVSAMLIAPIKKDASLFFKIALIILWIRSFIGPLILFLNLNFKWYFEKF